MKKLLSGLLTVVMFFALLAAIVLFGIRSALSESSVSKMLDVMIEEYDMVGDMFNEDEELTELFEEDKKAKNLMSKVVSGYVKYTMGITDDKPELEEFFEYVAEETDTDIDEDEIDEMIEEFEDEMEEEREAAEGEEMEMVKTIFSPSLLIISLVVVAGCAFVIYILSNDAKKAVKRIGIVSIISGVIVAGFGSLLMSFVEQEANSAEEVVMSVVEIMLNTFKSTGIISIIVGVALIIVAAKVLKKNTNIAASNQAIENLDNSVIK